MENEYVGYAFNAHGAVALIGIGPKEWLNARKPEGYDRIEYRAPVAADYVEPIRERDLSGSEIRDA